MNRVIKFRGMREGKRDWVYGGVYIHDQPSVDGEELVAIVTGPGDFYGVTPSTVGQFTGLADKNGKEIYEGDIVEQDDGFRQVVEFGVENVDAFVGVGFSLWPFTEGEESDTALKQFTIIGNVHQNPELLTE